MEATFDTPTQKPIRAQLKSICTNYAYLIGMPYVMLYFAACYVPAASWSPYGASWYGGCNTWKLQEKNSECLNDSDNFNYGKLNIYQSISYTGMGLVSFLFSGYMGRLSDAYGRKFFFIFFCVCKLIGYIPLLIVDNIWYNMALTPIAGLTGGNNSATPIMIAYGADVIPEDERTLAFAVMYFLGGIGLLIGSALGAVIEIYFGFYWIFVAIVGIWVLLIIYCMIFQYESLKPENRKPFESKCYNPLKPLLKLRAHPVVFWIGILQLFISLPETGVVDMSTMIVDDLLGVTSANDATMLNLGFNGVCAMGILIGNIVLLPFLKKFMNDQQILIVGAALLALSFVSFGLIPFLRIIGFELAYIGGFFLTLAFISFPAANSIVTKYLNESEQGEGVGIVYAMRSITFIIAPIGFASLYHLGGYLHFKSLIFIIGVIMALIAILIVVGPLRNAINDIKDKPKILYYSQSSIDYKKEQQPKSYYKFMEESNSQVLNVNEKPIVM